VTRLCGLLVIFKDEISDAKFLEAIPNFIQIKCPSFF
jgi:hypothetical protein